MMKKHTLIALLLALVTVAPSLVACAADETETDAPDNTVNADSDTTADTEDNTITPDIPALDFNGADFTFADSDETDHNGAEWATYDVWVDGTTGEALNDAVYERRMYLENTYKINMKEVKGHTNVITEQDVTSGAGEFDAVMTNVYVSCILATSGYTRNLYDVPYIDLSKSYWDQGCVEDLELLGGVYFANGDITVMDDDATWVLMFDKGLYEDNGFENIYEKVKNMDWYMDDMLEMMSTAARDVNGDGAMTWTDDIFGFTTSYNSCQGLFYASGEKFIYKDNDGKPYLTTSLERLTNVVEKTGKIMSDENLTILVNTIGSYDDMRAMFSEGRALFYGEVLQCVTRLRDSDADFGLIPWPMYDENQDGYHSFVHKTAGKGVCVTVACKDVEMSGAIIEAMAAKSVDTLTPAYYDIAITRKAMRDEESVEMLDIILKDRRYDLGYIYNWGELYEEVRGLIAYGETTVASTWEAYSGACEAGMNETIAALEKVVATQQ